MSLDQINQYYLSLDRAIQFGKSPNEQSVRNYFWMLLNDYARKFNYEVIPEVPTLGTKGKKVYPDGTVKNAWGLDIGHWESKDEKDDINEEINLKIKNGYPLTNILFEDTVQAVLFQRGVEVKRIPVRDSNKLDQIIYSFMNFKSDRVYEFEDAIEKFKADIPKIVEALRNRIIQSRDKNKPFQRAQEEFLLLCRKEINPSVTVEDIREMMIQHILTSDIFNKIFNDSDFHKHNTIASELEKLISSLLTYEDRRNLLMSIEHYYEAINATAAGITDHHEKQKFLKVLYENFYKVYNPKAADRLGVVYTPNEIVRYMVRSTDYLLHKHFGKVMADNNVEILDPATGTGTFISEIIEHAIPPDKLEQKYKNEIHANEVAILPYYIANLNIEYTYKQKMNRYCEFPNLCFVDTLDNISGLTHDANPYDLFGLTSENTERIKRQNSKKISVIIGNPPYNANQLNENENNKNREYPHIDKRIKDTYIKHSTAQKTKVYDMYARFYRWAMDRVDKKGIICMITNNSFINARTFDGFRKCIREEFDYAYIIDLGGNIRELSGKDGIFLNEEHTIFGVSAAVGIGIMFLVKTGTPDKVPCRIEYIHPCDIRAKRVEKLEWLKNNPIETIHFDSITPDKTNNWINLADDNDWEELIPVADKNVKAGIDNKAIFTFFSLGVNTARDEWVYDNDNRNIINKVNFLIDTYNRDVKRYKGKSKEVIRNNIDYSIKWTRAIKNDLEKGTTYQFDEDNIITCHYRSFIKKQLYFDKELIEMPSQNTMIFGSGCNYRNLVININANGKDLRYLSSNLISDYHFCGDTQCLPLYRYDQEGNRHDNITDWALNQFRTHYKDKKITKEDIFHYVYAVLHNPAYRKKYELNLKREFPRIPFYKDFRKWTAFGKELMHLHINYEEAEPYPLKVIVSKTKAESTRKKKEAQGVKEEEKIYAGKYKIKTKLKADKLNGIIEIDEITILNGIPKQAWEYKLGNRSALEWILDQYKEKKPKDPTIAEKFNTYRFADYKEHVLDLLKRVCTVSVRTMEIVGKMGEGIT
ncbi:MAG TPA: N-6 DNA methylase [Ignavibacteriaceae bacterium]|nr:N-6 DNA methylase [Ignavibacteriaceae bacterium]